MRAHAFKDAEAKNKEINVGTFNYPVLMAADILLYGTDVVPVGQDQKQHIEYTRDIAEKFNNTFGETFKLPEPIILEHVATVPGIDGKKMSKSYNNTIPLFATKEKITKLVMSIVTDSGAGIPENVYAIHKLVRAEGELKKLYEENSGKYKILKDALVEDLENFIKPLRDRREELAKNPDFVREVLAGGMKKANEIAVAKLREVKEKIGVL
jgi:tryptophanyl-tRNA synthetase